MVLINLHCQIVCVVCCLHLSWYSEPHCYSHSWEWVKVTWTARWPH